MRTNGLPPAQEPASDAATRAFAEAEKSGPIDEVISTGWAGALREEFSWATPMMSPPSSKPAPGALCGRLSPNDCCLVTSSRVAGAAEKKRRWPPHTKPLLVDMEAAGVAAAG